MTDDCWRILVPPVPEKDPIVSKSYAAYYVIAMLILMVTLFWALWDESFGQRPWKALQHVWKIRYSAFLNSTRSKSTQSVKEVEQNSQYQQLEQAYKDANERTSVRAAAAATGQWPARNPPGVVVKQENAFVMPSSFSPIR